MRFGYIWFFLKLDMYSEKSRFLKRKQFSPVLCFINSYLISTRWCPQSFLSSLPSEHSLWFLHTHRKECRCKYLGFSFSPCRFHRLKKENPTQSNKDSLARWQMLLSTLPQYTSEEDFYFFCQPLSQSTLLAIVHFKCHPGCFTVKHKIVFTHPFSLFTYRLNTRKTLPFRHFYPSTAC